MTEPSVAPTGSTERATENKDNDPVAIPDLLEFEGLTTAASEAVGSSDAAGTAANESVAEAGARSAPISDEPASAGEVDVQAGPAVFEFSTGESPPMPSNSMESAPISVETAPAGGVVSQAGPAIFELSTDESLPVRIDSAESASSTTAGTTGDWYSLDEEQANQTLEQRSQEAQLEESSQQESGSTNKPQNWASKLSKKAGSWGGRAKIALLAEAKLVAADAKDLALGVREGAQITIQDTKSLSKQLHRDAKSLASAAGGWRGLWRGGRKDQEPAAYPEEAGAAASGTSSENSTTISSNSTNSRAEAPKQATNEAPQVEREKPKPVSGDETTPTDLEDCPASGSSSSTADGGQASDDALALGSQEASGGPASGPAALQALRQSWAATAEVSKSMWKDIKEANREAMQDLRSGVQDLRQGVQRLAVEAQKPRHTSAVDAEVGVVGASDGVPPETAAPETLAEAQEARPQDTDLAQAMSDLENAVDMVTPGDCVDLPQSDDSIFDPRTPAEKVFDEKAAKVAQRVEEVGGAIAAASSKLWRKTEQGFKKGFAAVPEISKVSSGAPVAGTAFFSPATDGEDTPHFDEFRFLPSVHANFVELAAADPSSALQGDDATRGDAATPSAKKAAGAAARRARKIGGKIAKRSREVSGGLLKQARDLGQSVQAGAAEAAAAARSAVAGAGPSPSDASVNNIGDEACEEDDIFEIGSEDEELFAGESSGSEAADAADNHAEDEEDVLTAPVTVSEARASTPADAQETAPIVSSAAPPAAPPAGAPAPQPTTSLADSKGSMDEMMDLLFDASEVAPASTTGTALVPPLAEASLSKPTVAADAKDATAPGVKEAPVALPAHAEPEEDPFGDILELPSDFLTESHAPPSLPAAAPVQRAPAATTVQQPLHVAAASNQPTQRANIDFAAAEKELEDLFGDDD